MFSTQQLPAGTVSSFMWSLCCLTENSNVLHPAIASRYGVFIYTGICAACLRTVMFSTRLYGIFIYAGVCAACVRTAMSSLPSKLPSPYDALWQTLTVLWWPTAWPCRSLETLSWTLAHIHCSLTTDHLLSSWNALFAGPKQQVPWGRLLSARYLWEWEKSKGMCTVNHPLTSEAG